MKVPPPLFFLAGLGAGWLLHRRVPWPLPAVPGALRDGAGLVLAAAGFALAAWGLLVFRRARTAIFPHFPASRLVEHGPYRFTRNPMYVSLVLSYVGLAGYLVVPWALVLLPLPLLALQRVLIPFEEARLRRERDENDARLAAKAVQKMREVTAEATNTPEELAEKERKRAIIAAAMERARLKAAGNIDPT